MTTERHETMNALEALGVPDAGELSAKIALALRINTIIEKSHLTQTQAAELLAIQQPKVSALKNYKLDGFSLERLMNMLVALGRDVEIRVKKRPRNRPAEVRVTTA